MDAGGLLPEERRGALTQIFEEYKPEVAPDILERVVAEIDAVVMGARFTRWQTSREGERTVKTEIRKALKKFGLPATGELFERAYNYVAENY
jgi:type I restriction enzyme, R subunit